MTAAEILARLEIARHDLAGALRPADVVYEDDRVEDLIAEIVRLRHWLLIVRHEAKTQVAGRDRTVREWLIWKEEMSAALSGCRVPPAAVVADIAEVSVEIELQVQLSNATADIDVFNLNFQNNRQNETPRE